MVSHSKYRRRCENRIIHQKRHALPDDMQRIHPPEYRTPAGTIAPYLYIAPSLLVAFFVIVIPPLRSGLRSLSQITICTIALPQAGSIGLASRIFADCSSPDRCGKTNSTWSLYGT